MGTASAVHLENSAEAVIAVFAILKAGAVFLMVNPSTKATKLAYILRDSEARAIFLPARKVALLETCWSQTPRLETIITPGGAPAAGAAAGKARFTFEELAEADSWPDSPPKKRAIDVDLAALVLYVRING